MDEKRIAFGNSVVTADLPSSDADFLETVSWSRTAPANLVRAAGDGDVTGFVRILKRQHFGSAGSGGYKLARSDRHFSKQSLWSRYAFGDTPRSSELMRLWEPLEKALRRSGKKMGAKSARTPKSRANGRLAGTANAPKGSARINRFLKRFTEEAPPDPFEQLILFEMLICAGRELPDEVCLRLWRIALTAAVNLSDSAGGEELSSLTEDQRLLVAGELPWESGLLFAGVKGSAKFGRDGQRLLREELCDKTDTDGTPEAGLLEHLSLWLAPLVRSAYWAKRFRTRLWDAESKERFRALIKIVAGFCGADGRMALGNGSSGDAVGLLTSASKLAGWNKRSAPLKFLLAVGDGPHRSKRRSSPRAVARRLPAEPPVTQSDWARVACLRNNWSVEADTLLVAHHRQHPLIDLRMLGKGLLNGEWQLSISVDGKEQELDDQWTCACWYSDDDADFLELHMSPGKGLSIDRQLLLSRTDHFLLLADVVSGPAGARIDYRSSLKTVEGVSSRTATTTRECLLKIARQTVRVLPIGLPAERVVSVAGSLNSGDGRLQLNQAALGGLYAPLVFDWAPEHKRKDAGWRTLTVTEAGRILSSEFASGHRVWFGNDQLFVYRSVKRSDLPRSVLGLHTLNETVVGRFDASGEVDSLLLVE